MNRLTAATALATTGAAALLATVATTAPASAAEPAPLGTQLRYTTTTWTEGSEAMSMDAPRGWRFVVTPEGQARFSAPDRPDVVVMTYRGEGRLRPQIRAKIAALQGTPGLRILQHYGQGRGGAGYGELRYTWRPEGGAARYVAYRYQGDDAYSVAGRLVDRRGLVAVLDRASDTGDCGGGA